MTEDARLADTGQLRGLVCHRTSFGDLSKRQTRAALKVDILGEDKGAKGTERLAGEEVGFATLSGVSVE